MITLLDARSSATRAVRSPVVVLTLILVVLVGLPFVVLLVASLTDTAPRPGAGVGAFTLENFAALASAGTRTAAINSLVIAIGGTSLAMLIGGSLAWLAVRTDMPGRRLAQLAGIVPLFTSALVGSMAWALIGSPNAGYVNLVFRELGLPWTVNIYSVGGIVFVMGLIYAPYTFLLAQSALSLVSPDLEEAGTVHRASTAAVMRKITFPIITPALVGAGILTFVLISENFTVVQILGSPAGLEALPTRLYRLTSGSRGRPNEAAALGIALVIFFAVFIYLQRRIVSRRNFATVKGKGFRPKRIALGGWRWPAAATVVLYLVVAVALPYFALFQGALRSHQFIPDLGSFFDVSAFDVEQISSTLQYAPFQQGLRNSLVTSLFAALLGGALCFGLAYAARRTRYRGRAILEYAAAIPLATPALVIGIALLWTWTRLPLPIYGTLVILVIAFVVRFLPQGFQGIAGTIVQIDPELEEAAVVAGASKRRATMWVTLPLIRNGVVSAVLLLFLLSMRELSAALFLFTSDTRLLSIVIYDQWEAGSWSRVATMSLIYSLVLLMVTIFGRRWLTSSKIEEKVA